MKRILWLSAALTLTLVTAISAPANAHTDESVTNPTSGSSVSAGVLPIEVTFVEDLLQTEDYAGSDIVVQDAEGTLIPVTCAVVEGAVLSANVDLATAGTATVYWRTVGEDSHPIEGSFNFEVTNPNGYVATGEVTDCPNHLEHSNLPAPLDDKALQTTGGAASDSNNLNLLIGFGIAVVIIFFFSLLGALRIRRQQRESDRFNR